MPDHNYFPLFSFPANLGLSFIATSLLLTPLVGFLRKYFIDLPGERSSHVTPTPRGGGLAVSTMVLTSAFLQLIISSESSWFLRLLLTLLCCSFPISLIGFIDDRYSLSPRLRLLTQFTFCTLSISLIFYVLAQHSWWLAAFILVFPVVIFPLLIVLLVASINLTNFMDGLDGLVASSFLLLAFSASLLSDQYLWLFFCPPTLAFLRWNWSPARLFLGDSGSTWMGLWIALMALLMPSPVASLQFVFIASPLWLDASHTLIRRVLSGASPTQPHRLHLYQRLHQAGWSHQQVTLTYLLAMLLLLITTFVSSYQLTLSTFFLVCLMGVFLDRFRAAPFNSQLRS